MFSKLDAKSGYWSIQLEPESQLLTTFQSPFGRYCFQRLPFGLSVSQDIFQLKMDQILDQVEGVIAIADDIAVYAENEQEHEKILHNLMAVAEKNGLVFNSSKCIIKTNKIKFFGTIYSDKGVHPDPNKVADLRKMPKPNNKKELQEFLGFVTYLSPFIPNLSSKSSCLRDLLKNESLFLWEPHHQRCFDMLKNEITDESTLQYFDTVVTPIIQTDASLRGLGAVLIQNEGPVAYASKSLSDVEKRYACIERELLAIVFGVQRFHTYLYGRYFRIVTDHKPLVMITQKPVVNAPPRLQRMLLKLQGYNFSIEYKPGKELMLADTLSRLPSLENQETINLDVRVDLVKFQPERLESIRSSTRQDPVLNQLVNVIINGWPDTIKDVPTHIRSYWSFRDELSVEDGIILKGNRVVIPSNLHVCILSQLHYGHQGIEKTKLRAKDSVYWNSINKDIEDLIKKCDICQYNLPSQTRESLLPHEIPDQPWEVVGTDLFHFGNCEYLIIVDYYSKFPIIRKMPGVCSSGAVIVATKQIFSEYGIPSKVVSDNGPQFSSFLYKKFANEWCFAHVTSSPRYPQSNGFVERNIRTVKMLFQKAIQDNKDIDLALLCLRTTPISGNVPSPGELLMNRKVVGNIPVKTHSFNPVSSEKVKKELLERQSAQKMYSDKKSRDLPPLMPGQVVRVENQSTGKWDKAEVIDKCDEPRSYFLKTPEGQTLRRNRVHIREGVQPATQNASFADPIVTSNPKSVKEHPASTIDSSGDQEKGSSIIHPCLQNRPTTETTATDNEYTTRSGRVVKRPVMFDL